METLKVIGTEIKGNETGAKAAGLVGPSKPATVEEVLKGMQPEEKIAIIEPIQKNCESIEKALKQDMKLNSLNNLQFAYRLNGLQLPKIPTLMKPNHWNGILNGMVFQRSLLNNLANARRMGCLYGQPKRLLQLPAPVPPPPAPTVPAAPQNVTKRCGTYIPNRVFVGGISFNTSETDLVDVFSQFGKVRSIKIIVDRAGVNKGYGFVTFETEEEAQRLQNFGKYLFLRDRKLSIGPAIKRQVMYFKENIMTPSAMPQPPKTPAIPYPLRSLPYGHLLRCFNPALPAACQNYPLQAFRMPCLI